MTPAEFIAQHGGQWDRLAHMLGTKPDAATIAEFPSLYRRVCQHLALAQERHYPQALVERLNALALGGQQFLYQPRKRLLPTIGTFLAGDFAQHVRQHPRALALAVLIFYGPLLAGLLATLISPELIYSVMTPASVAEFEGMYDADRRIVGYTREDGDNLAMFGYYIANNIGIGFRTFAAGIFAGIGSLLLLFYNGAVIGMVAGFLTAQGHGHMFWQFVCGHSAFELNAIVLCGMTGLMLGHALIAPGRRRRRDALILAARDAVPILYGATFMLFVAAIVEAFWSSRTVIPMPVKYAVAAGWWLMVTVYFLRAGRHQDIDHES